ncbi:NAD-dependent epimerase/dehydratase family protein [Saccharopolyspora sp. HNM0986]|uniref:NAD-dependent epimerase/dehydratase family protein n=1 Tax=Saccharopolyspora galaxeae TaxID=2781241 RepID=UPI00190BD6EF|nr:NAD-dependent epimerase/dehydratase family protein [Saccharopolyspora sp. HNM0986]MBK0869462.1 NAD-dependent epimerase/dehydratase family protein [Saccharopolyspora sp. HNM0986]
MPQQLHVVLGAGPAGTALARELARRGHRARLVNRSGAGPDAEGVERARADVLDAAELRTAVHGADVVHHCVNVEYHRQVEVLPKVQDAVLAAAAEADARLVVLDTLYPYGETGGAVMTERTPMTATTRKGRMRAELDENYLAAHRSGRVRVALGRSADFFGPGVFNSTLGATAFPPALTGGRVLGFGNLDLLHSYTFIDDVAAGLAALGEHPESDGQVWHLPTAPASTTREVHEIIGKLAGRPLDVHVLREPEPFGPFDEVFMGEYAELFYQHTEHQVMDSGAFERTFGTRPTPLVTALETTLDWFRTAISR